MKLFYKLLTLIVVGAVAAPFILKDEAGRPLMSLDKLRMPDVSAPALPDIESTFKTAARKLPDIGLKETRDTVTAYKWQDADGTWHFSDKASARSGVEQVAIDPDASVMAFDQIPVTAPTAGQVQTASRPGINDDNKGGTSLLDRASTPSR